MTTFTQKNITLPLVGKYVSRASSGLNDGEIGAFTPGGTKLTEAAANAGDPFKLALGRGSTLNELQTPVINKNLVEKVIVKKGVSAKEQIDYIGYNGSGNSIDVINNNYYRIRLDIKEEITQNHGGVYVKDSIYKSSSSATQYDIALGLAANGNRNFDREAERGIVFKAIFDVAVNTNNNFLNNAVISNGSKVIEFSGNSNYGTAAPGTALAVGDYIRIADDPSSTVALTSGVYRVDNIQTVGGNDYVTVDRPIYVDTDGTYTGNSGHIEVIIQSTAQAANFGVKLQGQPLDFVVGKIHYRKMRWKTSLSNFGSTILTQAQGADKGSGTVEQVAELEWGLAGNFGEYFRMGEPNIFKFNPMVDTTMKIYDLIDILFRVDDKSSLVAVSNPQRITLAIPTSSAGAVAPFADGANADDITDVLEKLLDGVPVWNATKSGTPLTTGDLTL